METKTCDFKKKFKTLQSLKFEYSSLISLLSETLIYLSSLTPEKISEMKDYELHQFRLENKIKEHFQTLKIFKMLDPNAKKKED